MARPRTPAKVLELRGAFKKDPQRARTDAEGAAKFNIDPPTHLPQAALPAWRYIVERLPKVALSSSDEVAVESAARCLGAIWELDNMGGALNPLFLKLATELRQCLGVLGMTPVARTKIPATSPDKPGNPYADL